MEEKLSDLLSKLEGMEARIEDLALDDLAQREAYKKERARNKRQAEIISELQKQINSLLESHRLLYEHSLELVKNGNRNTDGVSTKRYNTNKEGHGGDKI